MLPERGFEAAGVAGESCSIPRALRMVATSMKFYIMPASPLSDVIEGQLAWNEAKAGCCRPRSRPVLRRQR